MSAPVGVGPAGGASARFETLPWDSERVGRSVVRLSIDAMPAPALAAQLELMRDDGVGLAYVFGAPADAAARDALDAAGAVLVDRRVTYWKPAGVLPAAERGGAVPAHRIARHDGRWPDDSLRALALAAGEHSRFRTDPRFPRAVFETIYDAWIARSVAGEIADAVLVARDGDGATGLVTVGVKQGRGDIGLLAVAERARGQGLGRALVAAANAWAVDRGLSEEQVVTQAANAPACRLYEQCGYAVESVVEVRHLWIDR